MTARGSANLLLAFIDLDRFTALTRRVGDGELAEIVDAYYERVAARIAAGGGRVVKFMGDGALAVFPEDGVDAGVNALLALKEEIDAWMSSLGWDCRLAARAHVGTVIAGEFGGAGDKRFDVIGREVNAAATLDHAGLCLSAAAFDRLSPALRTRFSEQTPPATYIRVEDPQRLRRDRH